MGEPKNFFFNLKKKIIRKNKMNSLFVVLLLCVILFAFAEESTLAAGKSKAAKPAKSRCDKVRSESDSVKSDSVESDSVESAAETSEDDEATTTTAARKRQTSAPAATDAAATDAAATDVTEASDEPSTDEPTSEGPSSDGPSSEGPSNEESDGSESSDGPSGDCSGKVEIRLKIKWKDLTAAQKAAILEILRGNTTGAAQERAATVSTEDDSEVLTTDGGVTGEQLQALSDLELVDTVGPAYTQSSSAASVTVTLGAALVAFASTL